MPTDRDGAERVSGILVGMVREMTAVNRDLAHQVAELRTDCSAMSTSIRAIEDLVVADKRRADERATATSVAVQTFSTIAKNPAVQLILLALALWVAKMLGIIEFLPILRGAQ
jgi:hypothetical protein